MTVKPGQSLGQYHITAQIGKGGMATRGKLLYAMADHLYDLIVELDHNTRPRTFPHPYELAA
jgi:hypothetical protein